MPKAATLVFPAHIFNAKSEYGKPLLPHLKKIWRTGGLYGLVIWQTHNLWARLWQETLVYVFLPLEGKKL